MTIAVIVQARMRSSRLPDKIMLELGGRTVLHQVLERCRMIGGADIVVCAVPDEAESAPIERVARECGAAIFRGSERDVLGRYFGAARSVGADVTMRVTSDCPLIDPEICAAVLALRDQEGADYAANNMPRSFPHGLDCEAFSTDVLAEAAASAQEPSDREHVTPWLRRAEHIKRANLHSGDAALRRHRWTLDYPEDLAFFRAVFSAFPEGVPTRMGAILELIARRPDIAKINMMHSDAMVSQER